MGIMEGTSSLGERDPTTLCDLSSFMAHLADEFPRALPPPASEQAQRTIAEVQRRMTVDLVHAVLPQILKIAEVVWKVEDFARRKLSSTARIVVLEFPVGNSIPSIVLDRVLRKKGWSSTVVRVALPRNDSTNVGVTSAQLLEHKLTSLALNKGDLIVLVDEWLSGSNFRNLTRLVERLPAISDALFLPVAIHRAASAWLSPLSLIPFALRDGVGQHSCLTGTAIYLALRDSRASLRGKGNNAVTDNCSCRINCFVRGRRCVDLEPLSEIGLAVPLLVRYGSGDDWSWCPGADVATDTWKLAGMGGQIDSVLRRPLHAGRYGAHIT